MPMQRSTPGTQGVGPSPPGAGDRVNAAVVHGKFMFLSGEICLTGGACSYGSRTEGQRESAGITTGPYRDSGSATGGSVWRDGTEVSTRHSSQTPTVMGGTG